MNVRTKVFELSRLRRHITRKNISTLIAPDTQDHEKAKSWMGYPSSSASSNSRIIQRHRKETLLFRPASNQVSNSRAVKPTTEPAKQSQGITKETTESLPT